MVVERKYEGETCVIIATGPSLDMEQIDYVHCAHTLKRCRVMTMNNSYKVAPFTDIHIACNDDWWEHYWKEDELLRRINADKWTQYEILAERFGINYIETHQTNRGLSTNPAVINKNDGSGPMAINLALHYGFKKLILLGHDMKFAKDYDGRKRKIGSTPRHFFGEYPKHMQHFPSVKVGLSKPGVIDGLIENYEQMIPDLINNNVEVVNCTPKSALLCFKMNRLEFEV